MSDAAVSRRLPASVLFPLLSAVFSLVAWNLGFPGAGFVTLVLALPPVISLYLWLLRVNERSAMEQAYNSIDVYRDGIRLVAKDAEQIFSKSFADSGVEHYQTLFRTTNGTWFLAEIDRSIPRGRGHVTNVRLLSSVQARSFLESAPDIYETWFGQGSSIEEQREESNPRMVSALFPGSTIRTFEEGKEDWKAHAYPLKLITIQAQGTSSTSRECLVRYLEEALDRVRTGGSCGVDYDDDDGFRFEVAENMELTIFPGESSQ